MHSSDHAGDDQQLGGVSDDTDVEMVLIPLPVSQGRWLCHLMARDLAVWGPKRRSQLTRQEALSYAWFVHDAIPGKATPPSLRRPAKQKRPPIH
jgi:hypothetical protein